MTTTAPAPHLAGNFAPVTDELTAHDLPATGRVPPELSGWYLRNGPNPHDAASSHWFFGDGMIHGVRLDGGRATSYRNRWVRTATFTDGARLYDEEGRPDFTASVANTHVIRHAGRTLALVETSFPYEIDCRPGRELETVGAYDFGRPGALTRYDLRHGTAVSHDFGPGRTPGEAAFAPADDRPGSRGWLITYVHDAATDTSDLVILDADDLATQPAAVVHLPRRVPFGFHGNWLPDPPR